MKNNFVAKHAYKYNKSKVFKDKKKEFKNKISKKEMKQWIK